MKHVLTTRVIGTESKISARGNAYDVVAFMDGTETVQGMVDANCDVTDLPLFEPVDLALEISLGRFKDVKVMSWARK